MGHSALGDAQKPATCKPCSVQVSSVVRLYAHSGDMIGACIANPMLCYAIVNPNLWYNYSHIMRHYWHTMGHHGTLMGQYWDIIGTLWDINGTILVHYAQKPGTCKPCSVVRLQQNYSGFLGRGMGDSCRFLKDSWGFQKDSCGIPEGFLL